MAINWPTNYGAKKRFICMWSGISEFNYKLVVIIFVSLNPADFKVNVLQSTAKQPCLESDETTA